MGGNQSGFPPAPPTGARPQEEGVVPREKTATTNTCFNCGVVGHFRSDCTEPEQCILCGDVSHLAMACTARNRHKARETLEFLGHGIDGGFYYLDMGGAKPSVPQHLAVISVLPTQDPPLAIEITAEIIRTELAQLECDCVWNVREVSPSEFAVAFPSAELLRAVSWSETTILLLHNIKVSIKPSCVDPEIVASLSSVWVRVHGIPAEARKDSFLELISQAIGKLEEVDGQSLAGQGPVRLRVLCPNPSKLNCSISPFFFRKDGMSLVVELESEEDQGGSMPHSPRTDQDIPREPWVFDDYSSGDDDGGSDRDGGGAMLPPPVGVVPPPTSAPPSRTMAPVVAPVQASSLGPRCPGSVVLSRSAPAKLVQVDAPRSLRSDPVESFGFPLSQYGSNFCLSGLESPPLSFKPRPLSQSPGEVQEDSLSVGMEVVPPSSPCSPGVVCYMRSLGSTPSLPQGPTTPAPAILALVSIVPDTPGTGTVTHGPRRAR
jgi:hypothetical protein